jgi:PAS domain S-box-containing protein
VLREKRPVYGVEHAIEWPDGKRVLLSINAAPVLDDGGSVTQVVCTVLDVTAQKRLEAALRESESRVRRKLAAVLEPEGDVGRLELADVLDVPSSQALMNNFYALTHIGVGIIDLQGKVLVATGWQDICTRFHRVHPETRRRCIESDLLLSRGVAPGTFRQYRCENMMWDMASPIVVGGVHLGNIFLGQFFFDDEVIDLDAFREQARRYGFDEAEYISALERVPRWSRETVDAAMRFYSGVAETIGASSYGNIRLARALAERDATLESLRESERSFRSLFESMMSGFALHEILLDADGKPADYRFLSVNPAFERLTGLKAADIVGRTVLEVMPDLEPKWIETYGKVAVSGEPADFEDYSGPLDKCFRVSAYRTEAGRFVTIFDDVTERRRTESALRQSEEKYRALFEQSLEAIWLVTPGGAFLDVNQAFLRLFGYEREDMASVNARDVYEDPTERDTVLQHIREIGFVEGEVRLKRKDGATFDCERHLVALRDQSGNIIALQGVARDITERKRAEAALRESEEKYRSLFEHSADAIWLTRPDGSGNIVNPAWLRMFGYEPDDMPGFNAADIYVNPEERADFLHNMMKRGFLTDEVRFKRKDGAEFDCERTAVALRDEFGNVFGFQGVLRDITREKQQKQALADELARRRILLEQSRDGIVVLDEDGLAVETNRTFARMLGYSPEEVLQLHVWDWEAVASRERLGEMLRSVDETGDHFETQHRRKDGTLYDVEISTNGAVFGGRKLIFCVCRDITERKRAEEALRASEERFRGVFEHGPMGIAIADTSTFRIVRANRAYAQIVGYTEDELTGMYVGDLTSPDDWKRQQELIQARIEAGYSGYVIEKHYIRKDGETRDVLVVGEVMRDAPGEPQLLIASVLDITDRKRVERELAESRQDLRLLAQRAEQAREEERTAIARELHDLVGQTLTAVKLDIDRLRRFTETAAPESVSLLDGMAEMVTAGAEDVRRISSELRPGALDDLGLAGAIEWQLDQLRPRAGIVLTFNRDETFCDLDPARNTALFRVFQELVTNVVRHARANSVDVSLQAERDACVLTVTDDGVGIDAGKANDRHSLGIVGMRERLLPYGGELYFESAPGGGTTARVIMPLR